MVLDEQIAMVVESQRRIEGEMVEMRRAIVSLARIEERLTAHVDGVHRIGARIDRVEETVNAIEKRIDTLEQEKMRTATIIGIVSGIAGVIAPSVIGWFLSNAG